MGCSNEPSPADGAARLRGSLTRTLTILALIGVLLAAPAGANVVTNGSFEEGSPGTTYNFDTVPHWGPPAGEALVDSGLWRSGPGYATDGDHLMYVRTDEGAVIQTTGHVISANEAFELLFDSSSWIDAADLRVSLYYGDDTARTSLVTEDFSPAGSPMTEYTLSFNGPIPGAAVGKNLGVEFDAFGEFENYVNIDDVRLNVAGSAVGPLPGDLDVDGDVDDVDVDLLRAALGDPTEDLDGDSDVDGDDLIFLVHNYLEWHRSNPGDGVGTEIGDITLDGLVGEADLAQMVLGFGGVGGWGEGNLNTDTLVDGSDLALLMANFGADMEDHAPVPEPATLMILAAGAAGMLRRRR